MNPLSVRNSKHQDWNVKTLGIECCDQGFMAAVSVGPEEELVALEDNRGLASPGFVYFDGEEYRYGSAAEAQAKLLPKFVSDRCWDQLSRRASDITAAGKSPLYSELAYHYLKSIWDRICTIHSADQVLLALPGDFLEGELGDEERIGLILGMVKDMEIPLAGIIDLACAAVLAHMNDNPEMTKKILMIDLPQHALIISQIDCEAGIRRMNVVHSSRCGHASIFGELVTHLSNRFLGETAFDALHNAESEQCFYNQVKGLLGTLKSAPRGIIEMGSSQRSRTMTVSKEDLALGLESTTTVLIDQILNAWGEAADKEVDWSLLLSERAAAVPGLSDRLQNAVPCAVYSLQSGAAARGAVLFGRQASLIRDLEETPLTVSITRDQIPISPRIRPDKLATPTPVDSPTHLVHQGVAYPLRNGPLNLALITGASVEDGRTVTLHLADNGVYLEPQPNSPVRLNQQVASHRTKLNPGDQLQFHSATGILDLLLVKVMSATG